jgi:hypothetical protein
MVLENDPRIVQLPRTVFDEKTKKYFPELLNKNNSIKSEINSAEKLSVSSMMIRPPSPIVESQYFECNEVIEEDESDEEELYPRNNTPKSKPPIKNNNTNKAFVSKSKSRKSIAPLATIVKGSNGHSASGSNLKTPADQLVKVSQNIQNISAGDRNSTVVVDYELTKEEK